MPSQSRKPANVTTKVKGWQQRSLFNSYELAPYKKRRWKYIQARLAREKQEQDER